MQAQNNYDIELIINIDLGNYKSVSYSNYAVNVLRQITDDNIDEGIAAMIIKIYSHSNDIRKGKETQMWIRGTPDHIYVSMYAAKEMPAQEFLDLTAQQYMRLAKRYENEPEKYKRPMDDATKVNTDRSKTPPYAQKTKKI